jgi:hypothetical protein
MRGLPLLVLLPLTCHGGVGRVRPPAMSGSEGGVGGCNQDHELIHDGGILASATLCRQGVDISTSSAEAFLLRRGCSKLPDHEVMRSP